MLLVDTILTLVNLNQYQRYSSVILHFLRFYWIKYVWSVFGTLFSEFCLFDFLYTFVFRRILFGLRHYYFHGFNIYCNFLRNDLLSCILWNYLLFYILLFISFGLFLVLRFVLCLIDLEFGLLFYSNTTIIHSIFKITSSIYSEILEFF